MGIRRTVLAALLAAPVVAACASAPEPAELASGETTGGPVLGGSPRTTCPAPFDQVAPQPGPNRGYDAGGQSRTFELILPPASFTGPRPVFFVWHGTGESGRSFINRARLNEWAARGFIVVAPDTAGNGVLWPVWDGMHLHGQEGGANPDLALFDSLLSCTSAHFEVDPTRIYVGGHSAGGIMTNHTLRTRSKVLAGGIVGSGVFDFTQGASAAPLDPMTVVVAWGGDDDGFGGGEHSGFSFVEQAALASSFYESEKAVGQLYCRGNDIGHSWLPMNDWFIDLLLARPKGTPADTLALAPLPPNARSVCSTDVYAVPVAQPVVCPASPRAGCEQQCQLLADCAMENYSVGISLASELRELGITRETCTPCVERCTASADTAEDVEVLACLAKRSPSVVCGGGMEGSLPMFQALDGCCAGKTGSFVCTQLCGQLAYSVAGMLLPSCGVTEWRPVVPTPPR